MKKILVVMALYNKEKYVKRAIESILNQTYKNFSLIIVDDNSTDNSLKIAENFLYDKRVKIIKNKINGGCFYSKNVGIQFMENLEFDVYTTHDADDYSDPTRFEKIIKFFNDENLLMVNTCEKRIGKKYSREAFDFVGTTFSHAFYSRKVWEIFGYFHNVLYSGDVELWRRVVTYCKINPQYKIINDRELLYYAEWSKNSMLLEYPVNTRSKYDFYILKYTENLKNTKNFYRNFFSIDESVKVTKCELWLQEEQDLLDPISSTNSWAMDLMLS